MHIISILLGISKLGQKEEKTVNLTDPTITVNLTDSHRSCFCEPNWKWYIKNTEAEKCISLSVAILISFNLNAFSNAKLICDQHPGTF